MSDEGETERESKSWVSKQKNKTKSSTPILDNFSRDITKYAEEGKLDPVIGRKMKLKEYHKFCLEGKKIIHY